MPQKEALLKPHSSTNQRSWKKIHNTCIIHCRMVSCNSDSRTVRPDPAAKQSVISWPLFIGSWYSTITRVFLTVLMVCPLTTLHIFGGVALHRVSAGLPELSSNCICMCEVQSSLQLPTFCTEVRSIGASLVQAPNKVQGRRLLENHLEPSPCESGLKD